MNVFDLDPQGQRAIDEQARNNAITAEESMLQIQQEKLHAEIGIVAGALCVIAALIAMRKLLGNSAMQWIAVSVFLLLIAIVCAGTYFLLGKVLQEMVVTPYGAAGFFTYTLVTVLSIFASYYAGKYAHNLLEQLIKSKN